MLLMHRVAFGTRITMECRWLPCLIMKQYLPLVTLPWTGSEMLFGLEPGKITRAVLLIPELEFTRAMTAGKTGAIQDWENHITSGGLFWMKTIQTQYGLLHWV